MVAHWLKNPSAERFGIWLAGIVLKILLMTIRWRSRDLGGKALIDKGNAVIFVNWHSRLLAVPSMIGRHYPTAYIISPSRDGRMISGMVASLGVETIWGSKSQKALSGYRDMRRRLMAGQHVGITPDGPRGPARKAALGAVSLAKTSGAPLVPIAWSTSRLKRMTSWDRLAVPRFFAQGIQLWGEPITIPKNADAKTLERACLGLENAINELTAEADAYFGHPPDHAESRYGDAKEKR